MNRFWLSTLILAAVFPVAAAAAQTQTLSPSALNERQGATTGLGASHRFQTAAEAANHCPGDTVVWLSGPNLIYYLPGTAKYGTGTGMYACKAEADDAGFRNATTE